MASTKGRQRKAAPTRSLEQTLWDAADKTRGNLEAAEYKHVALGLVFLKYVSDTFEQRRSFLEAATADPDSDFYVPNPARRDAIVESLDEYASENVFWVPPSARWPELEAMAKQHDIGVRLDAAMDAIEKENPGLRGVLPKSYARAEIDKRLVQRDAARRRPLEVGPPTPEQRQLRLGPALRAPPRAVRRRRVRARQRVALVEAVG